MVMKFFIGFIFATLLALSTQKEPLKIFDKQCKRTAEAVDECWVKHSDLPDCKNSDPTVVCGQDASQKMRLCNKEMQKMSKQTVRNYEIIHEAVCDNEGKMKEEFEKKPACWYTARNCAMKLLNKTATAIELDSLDCKDAVDEAAECSSFDPWCSEFHENITIAVYAKSECGNTYPEEEKFVSSALKLDAFNFVLFALFVLTKSYLEI
uniref:DUF19 domain-containing protein n=1 Tax=Strigamia maritima TaxID=126957 RepID=T1ITB8_STRMM